MWQEYFLSFGSVAFLFCMHFAIFPLERHMATPSHVHGVVAAGSKRYTNPHNRQSTQQPDHLQKQQCTQYPDPLNLPNLHRFCSFRSHLRPNLFTRPDTRALASPVCAIYEAPP